MATYNNDDMVWYADEGESGADVQEAIKRNSGISEWGPSGTLRGLQAGNYDLVSQDPWSYLNTSAQAGLGNKPWDQLTDAEMQQYRDWMRVNAPIEEDLSFFESLGALAKELGPILMAMGGVAGLNALGLGGAGAAGAGAATGAAGGLGAADIAGLTQMGIDAGLSGSALSSFVSSGGMSSLSSLAGMSGAPSWLSEAAGTPSSLPSFSGGASPVDYSNLPTGWTGDGGFNLPTGAPAQLPSFSGSQSGVPWTGDVAPPASMPSFTGGASPYDYSGIANSPFASSSGGTSMLQQLLQSAQNPNSTIGKLLSGALGGGGTGTGGLDLSSLIGMLSGAYSMFGNQGLDQSQMNELFAAGQNTYNTSRNPMQGYDMYAQRTQDQSRAADSARGITMGGVSAGNENDAMRKFNIDWANTNLGREATGVGAFANAAGVANNISGQNFNQNQVGLNNLTTGVSESGIGTWLNNMFNPATPAYGGGY